MLRKSHPGGIPLCYRKTVLFLEGRHNAVIKELEREMKQAAAREAFEKPLLFGIR
jgi:hypothetical protein